VRSSKEAICGLPAAAFGQANPANPAVDEAWNLQGCIPPLQILDRGETKADVIRSSKPAAVWKDDLLWVKCDSAGERSFVIGSLQWVRLGNAPPFWALLGWTGKPATTQPSELVEQFATTQAQAILATLPLTGQPKDDEDGCGKDNFAMLVAQDASGDQIYELGYATYLSPSHPSDEERRIFVMRSADGHWQFVGEGPLETNDHPFHFWLARNADYVVRFTGDPARPVMIRFTMTETSDAYGDADSPRDVEHKVCRRGVIDGPLPAMFHWTGAVCGGG
jgi:hypothetical protein